MDGRDRTLVTLPHVLILMIRRYQKTRNLASFTAAVTELLETHPSIAAEVDKVYAVTKQTGEHECPV